MNKIKIERDLKIQLLQAIRDGYLDLDTMPEWFSKNAQSKMCALNSMKEIRRIMGIED